VGVSGTVTISGAGATATTGKVGNLSTRGLVQSDPNFLIGGIIIQDSTKKILVRGIGPSLAAAGITNALPDPTLELHDSTPGSPPIASNDNWQTTQIGGVITSSQVAEISSSGLAPNDPKESAVIATLPPGNYTVIVRGANGTVGLGLVEVYAMP